MRHKRSDDAREQLPIRCGFLCLVMSVRVRVRVCVGKVFCAEDGGAVM